MVGRGGPLREGQHPLEREVIEIIAKVRSLPGGAKQAFIRCCWRWKEWFLW
jgi:hypothetical protein